MNPDEVQLPSDQFEPTQVEPGVPKVEDLDSGTNSAKRKIILAVALIIGIILVVLVIVILRFSHLLPSQTLQKPNSISKPAPVTLNLARGNLTTIDGSNIIVNSYGSPKTFSITSTKDFQKIVSGTVKTGDARTGPATASELKVGQEVLVIADVGSVEAKTVYILR